MPVGTATQLFASRYRLGRRLANGGQGEVWRAHDEVLDRAVAVKLVGADGDVDAVALQRLEREAKAAAALVHPNVAQVLDFVRDDGLAGIVMELLEGETLAERIRRQGPLPVDETVMIGSGILAALAVAHDAGLVHRDIKPSNVVITGDGFVKVTDFGIAAVVGGDVTITEPGTVMGSAPYLAPEQVRGEPPQPASDIYSTALVLYEALTRQLPFEADTPPAVALARLQRPPAPVRAHRPDVPETLAAVVMRGLQQDPRARFATADAMRGALEAAGAAVRTEANTDTDTDATETWAISATSPLPQAGAGDAPAAEQSDGLATTGPVDPPRDRESRRWLVPVLLALLVFLAGLFAGNAVASRSGAPQGGIEVPALTGLAADEARQQLTDLGLEAQATEVPSEEAAGTVVGQDVAAGVFVVPGTPVNLQVSNGNAPCCTVPSVTGMALADAQRTIGEAGLVLDEVEEEKSDLASGTVISQEPPPGEQVDEGSSVDVLVAAEEEGEQPFPPGKGRGNDKDDD